MRRYRPSIALVIAALVILAWIVEARILAPPVLRTTTPRWGPLAEGVYATGVVEPLAWAKVRTEAGGRLVSLLVTEGQDVAAGELLAQIDDQKQRARIAELEARLRYLEAERERQRALVAGGAASRKTLELLHSEFDQAAAQRVVAGEELRQTRVTAPIGGRALRREGRVGEVVVPGTLLFWIGSPRAQLIVAQIDEEYFPRVEPGQRALVSADAHPGRSFAGRVIERTPFGDPDQRSFRIRIALDVAPGTLEPAESLSLGMTVEVNVVVRSADRALLVPRASIAGTGLWVVEAGRTSYRPIRIGLRGRDLVEVLEGLVGDEEIVLDPPVSLVSGARVRPLREPAENAAHSW
ncbi:RND family efflux transporter MFP subunit [Stella humosa]|uniref:RND family efflux transporter MFP subunit n=1 Tax=Stella humosa TaxID=94 RepID=A0A3N1KQE0_9PROT|nr:efflux RND transporter periplasmic adaptor subunit [Stella humosa]ROP81009.1 RND family efflux transporter MFP subunit [Stella humosa]BBK29699.1 RND transporter [Stella humosa]